MNEETFDKKYADVEAGYEIGYGKPPVRSRFVSGTSGNKKGRPKQNSNASQSFAEIERRLLLGSRDVKLRGKRTKMPVWEIILTKLTERAAAGDMSATKTLVWLAKQNDRSARIPLSIKDMSDCELQLLKRRIAAEQESK